MRITLITSFRRNPITKSRSSIRKMRVDCSLNECENFSKNPFSRTCATPLASRLLECGMGHCSSFSPEHVAIKRMCATELIKTSLFEFSYFFVIVVAEIQNMFCFLMVFKADIQKLIKKTFRHRFYT